jgi:hypothetical protein
LIFHAELPEKFASGKFVLLQPVNITRYETFHLTLVWLLTVVRKPVFTFSFSRATPLTRDLYLKLCKARDSKAIIICATPTMD